MLTPSEYDHLCDRLIFLYDELDRSIIEDMTRRMMRMGYVSEATKWQAKQLQESGLLYEDILAEISKRTDATKNHVRTLFEDAGVQSIRNDNNRYRSAGLSGIVKMSDSALQILNAGYIKCRGSLHNLTLTTANTAQQEYINACDLAYMQVTSGTMDYGTAIRRAVQSTASKGSWVLYPTGHRDRLDVAVRRSVLTGVGQTVRQLSAINANDMGCDLMEITAHAGARPSHAQWQGQIVSLSGRKGYLSPKDIGYGTGDGFGGWNCRHDWYPYFEGISERAYSEERLRELNARNIEVNGQKYTEYETSQMQRKLERKVREMKRRVLASETALKNASDQITANQMQDFFASESAKLKKAEQKLKDFLNQTGNLPDSTRTWVNGFGRSTAQKAVHANKKFKAKNNLTFPSNSGNINNKISFKADFPIKPLSENAKLFFDTYVEQYSKKFPKYAEALAYRFNNGSEKFQNLFLDNVLYNSIADNLLRGEDACFNPENKKIYMNFVEDFALNGCQKGIGTVYFHEHGHLIDNASGNISFKNPDFLKLLKEDFDNFKNQSINNVMSYNELYKVLSEKLQNLRTDNGISDIMNGLSDGLIKGCAYHDKNKDGSDYWNDRTICQEAFAHMFEAQFDEQKYERMKSIFPQALKEFENMV